MIAGLPLAFTYPLALWGLLALPVIWWLLRLTPPQPQTEVFPPLAILARVLKREETPHKSPWWLTALRLALAALVILALAGPVFNPRETLATEGRALALVIDNGWASAPDWDKRVATAARLIDDAGGKGAPVILALTAEKPNSDIGPFDATAARDRLAVAEPRPVPVDRAGTYARVAAALETVPGATVAVLSDGLAAFGDEAAFAGLLGGSAAGLIWFAPESLSLAGLTAIDNEADALVVTAVRPTNEIAPALENIAAFDDKGRRIAETQIAFATGQARASGAFRVPFELRNDFTAVKIDGADQAGAMRVLDESSRRRRVGLLSAAEADTAQPLLSPLYYIRRALAPFADLVEPGTVDLEQAIPALIDQKPAVIVMADIGVMPDRARLALTEWLEGGGTLVRFAGPRLAAASADDDLLPVRLRFGERALGGSLSWTEPQPVAEFPPAGPFFELAPPHDVQVSRQVLAEPTPDIVEHTWANLADGTPLVTGARRAEGRLVLFHVSPEATWSNLPISGSFVEMLRRIVQLSRNQGRIDAASGGAGAALAPYRMISATGTLGPPPPDARPLDLSGAEPPVTLENPPGLYGSEEGVVAHNLLGADAALEPLAIPQTPLPVTRAAYAFDESKPLKGPLLGAALALLGLDTLAVFWLGGVFANRRRARAARAAAVLPAVFAAALALAALATSALAQDNDSRPGDAQAIAAIEKTRIAYVITGDPAIDAVSRAGLAGLTQYLAAKTALEPGEPAGVDITKDELAFYPLIYWPVDAAVPVPDQSALARIDAYMKQGGTVLFDTRDQYSNGFDDRSASPATRYLREILADINVPPLEPVPDDHVLTKSFYILNGFPGRFNGSPLWVEASLDATSREGRPVRVGDGVSPILITANDLAGAWAVDQNGDPLLPTVPADPLQRIYAYRAGVNIMMYMLTGNYKSDQVHVPILLERLGQ